MELPELSLAPSWSRLTPDSSSSESSETSSSRKRKAISDSILESKLAHRNIIDLQHSSERLPFDWEQFLDLQSGKIYFVNKKTLKKSWDRPTAKDHQNYHPYIKSQQLDLDLNISLPMSNKQRPASVSTHKLRSTKKSEQMTTAQAVLQITRHSSISSSSVGAKHNKSNNDNTVAMACMNCHMLVLVSKSSPTCPNCKFVHSIPPAQQTILALAPRKPTITFKPLDTLTLFS